MSTHSGSPHRRWIEIGVALAALGALLSGYLLYRIHALQSAATAGADVCSVLFGAGCDETLLRPTSWQLGLPVPLWGLVYFVAVGSLLWRRGTRAVLGAFYLNCAGAGASVVFTSAFLLGWVPVCPICILVHLVNFVLVGIVLQAAAERMEPAAPAGAEAPGTAAESGVAGTGPRAVYVMTALALVVGAAFQAYMLLGGDGGGTRPRLEAALAEYRAMPEREVPVSSSDPVRGSRDAPVRMVVFGDFQCPPCQRFFPVGERLHEEFGEPLALVYKDLPLDRSCNPALGRQVHPRACAAARAAEAARLQGAFWPYHDRLYTSDLSASERLLKEIATSIGLDHRRWEADRRSQRVEENVRADVRLALELGVGGTPAVFLQGKEVPAPSYPVLRTLVDEALAEADRPAPDR